MEYCVYLVTYNGNLLPKYYIGSSSVKKVASGRYFGSIRSIKWKEKFKFELINNPHLFSIEILSKHESRIDALKEELSQQKINNVVSSDKYFNESFASINGMFGHDVNGKNNPMFGKKRIDMSIRMSGDNNIAKRNEVKEKLKLAKANYRPIPHKHTEIAKNKMSEIAFSRSIEQKNKINSLRSITNNKNINEKYGEFIIEIIDFLKNNDGKLKTKEIYEHYKSKPTNYINSTIALMRKRNIIYSTRNSCNSLTILV